MDLLALTGCTHETLMPGMVILRGRAGPAILKTALAIIEAAPPRNMVTPWGKTMSAKITNCGPLGWVSDAKGYRYTDRDPVTGKPWPEMPAVLGQLAKDCAAAAGFQRFLPDACLVNVYEPGAKMALHQDRDEADFSQPIVSVSLGASAIFRVGGLKRSAPSIKIRLDDGDVVVFGGDARLHFHGIDRILSEPHPLLGVKRINLTFRMAA